MDNSHLEHDMGHAMKKKAENGHDHHHMIIDFKRRLLICLILTIPILIDFYGLMKFKKLIFQPLQFQLPYHQFFVF